MDNDLIDTGEAMRILGLTTLHGVRWLIKQKKLEALNIGGRWVLSSKQVKQYKANIEAEKQRVKMFNKMFKKGVLK